MKHLKPYGIFEAKEVITEELFTQIKSYLDDVFLELEDNGFEFKLSYGTNRIFISIEKVHHSSGLGYDYFKTSEVLSTIEHAISYLSDIGLNLEKVSDIMVIRALIKAESPNAKYLPKETFVIDWKLLTLEELEKDYDCREIRLAFQ